MTVQYKYYICDVFTKKRFGGNPLAVLPEAEGLKDKQMLQIAREFNFSESSFVFPPENGNTRKVRMFSMEHSFPLSSFMVTLRLFMIPSSCSFSKVL